MFSEEVLCSVIVKFFKKILEVLLECTSPVTEKVALFITILCVTEVSVIAGFDVEIILSVYPYDILRGCKGCSAVERVDILCLFDVLLLTKYFHVDDFNESVTELCELCASVVTFVYTAVMLGSLCVITVSIAPLLWIERAFKDVEYSDNEVLPVAKVSFLNSFSDEYSLFVVTLSKKVLNDAVEFSSKCGSDSFLLSVVLWFDEVTYSVEDLFIVSNLSVVIPFGVKEFTAICFIDVRERSDEEMSVVLIVWFVYKL